MLRAGVACLDITPPLGTNLRGYFEERTATAVHDPLHVRAFALEQGGEGIAVAICDIIAISGPAMALASSGSRPTGCTSIASR